MTVVNIQAKLPTYPPQSNIPAAAAPQGSQTSKTIQASAAVLTAAGKGSAAIATPVKKLSTTAADQLEILAARVEAAGSIKEAADSIREAVTLMKAAAASMKEVESKKDQDKFGLNILPPELHKIVFSHAYTYDDLLAHLSNKTLLDTPYIEHFRQLKEESGQKKLEWLLQNPKAQGLQFPGWDTMTQDDKIWILRLIPHYKGYYNEVIVKDLPLLLSIRKKPLNNLSLGKDALETLKRFASNTSLANISDDYELDGMNAVPELKKVRLGGLSDVFPPGFHLDLHHLPHLEQITVFSSPSTIDLSACLKLKSLEFLTTTIPNLNSLQDHPIPLVITVKRGTDQPLVKQLTDINPKITVLVR